VAVLASLSLAGCFGRKKVSASAPGASSAEPDKVLFDRASDDMKHARYTTARLGLQTLINTYPDSEYLAKAKLAIADSYYKEGGTSGLTQAAAEYQDFITFFPFLDEAAYAQLQIGMAHYRQMEKPDRDRNEAEQAEAAFQNFLEKYPKSELRPGAEQDLRNIQEVLAEGDYRIGNFYFIRHVDRAAAARLAELVSRYPLYSQADHANWMLGEIYERNERNDLASQYYARIAKDYPLSPLAADAKAKLVKLNVPVPQPDPTALARMQKEQQTPHKGPGVLGLATGMFKSEPDVHMAAHTGEPTLTPPPGDTGLDSLNGGTGSAVAASPTSAPTTGAVVEIIQPNPSSTGSASSSMSSSPESAGSSDPASAASSPAGADSQGSPGGNDQSQATDTPAAQPSAQAPGSGGGKESSSKKKKGLRKIIPF